MRKGIFIIPYFGKFNNYFQLFLNSCKTNEDFDWLIVTDDCHKFDYPSNVIVRYCSFEELKKKIQDKFDFKIALNRPYKLCDFKAAYGYIFSEEIKNYKMWGYCDTDLIFGTLSHFITDNDIEKFDKIGVLGHCTLYRNTAEINKLFMALLDDRLRHKEVYTTGCNCSFDEEFNSSINNIFEQYKKNIRYTEYEANIYTKSSDFKLTYLHSNKYKYLIENAKKSFFVWDKGELMRYYIENGKLIKQEYMYIHMQSRPMNIRLNLNHGCRRFKIIPNTFEEIELYPVTMENFDSIRKKYFNLHYFRLRSKNLYKKLQAFIWK